MFWLIYSDHQTHDENKKKMFTAAWDLYKYTVI